MSATRKELTKLGQNLSKPDHGQIRELKNRADNPARASAAHLDREFRRLTSHHLTLGFLSCGLGWMRGKSPLGSPAEKKIFGISGTVREDGKKSASTQRMISPPRIEWQGATEAFHNTLDFLRSYPKAPSFRDLEIRALTSRSCARCSSFVES